MKNINNVPNVNTYLTDNKLAEVIMVMLSDEQFKTNINQLIRDKDFLQYNNSNLKRLFWAIIFNEQETIEDLKKYLNINISDISQINKSELYQYVFLKYLKFKWFKLLPDLLNEKNSKKDWEKLQSQLEQFLLFYTQHNTTFQIDGQNTIITFDNLNKLLNISNTPVYSQIKELDKIVGDGFYGGRTYLFAGGSGDGKSTLLRTLALQFAKQNIKTLFITLEMSAMEVLSLINKAIPDKNELNDVMKNLVILEDLNYNYHNIPSYFRMYRPSVLILDYIDEYSPTDWKVMDDVIKFLRYYSKIKNIPIITASQLNRTGYNQLISENMQMAIISGSFEKIKKSEFVGLISLKNNIFTIKVLKNRWGKKDVSIKLKFNTEKLIIEEINNNK